MPRSSRPRLGAFHPVLAGALLLAAAALLAGTLLALRPRSHPVELAVAASGATGIGLQLALLIAFQAGTGALYGELGLLVAGYMLGAAAGAAVGADEHLQSRRDSDVGAGEMRLDPPGFACGLQRFGLDDDQARR